MTQGVCAAIVTYNPDLAKLSDAISALRSQVATIVVIDNGSPPNAMAWLRQQQEGDGITVLPQGRNTGVAAAQNQAIRWAREQGFDFVLIMDQDSVPAPDMVDALRSAWLSLEEAGEPVGAVGPIPTDPSGGAEMPFFRVAGLRAERIPRLEIGKDPVPVAYLISSGSLIRLKVFDRVGLMDEGLFIDGVDLDWCFRASARGLRSYVVPAARLQHSLGDRRYGVWLFGRRQILQHNPTRLYFMVRNALLMARRAHIPAGWTLYSLRLVLKRLVAFGLLVPPKADNLRMMLAGLWDGLLGRTGPLPGRR
jgi:rhamnosyltransferase